MRKVLLEYDASTGLLKDSVGNVVGSWVGLIPFDQPKSYDRTQTILSMYKEGLSAEDIKVLL